MDPYTVLGVSTGASMQEIHSQYKKLCLQLHPDKAGEASTAACQRVNAAYQRIVASKKSSVEDVPEESYRRLPQQNNDPLPEPKYRRPPKENRDCLPEPKNRNNRQPGPEDFCKTDHEEGEFYDDLTGPQVPGRPCSCGCGGPESLSEFHVRSDRHIIEMTVAEEKSQNCKYVAAKKPNQENSTSAVGKLHQEQAKYVAAKKLNQEYRERLRSGHKATKDVKRYEQELERAVIHASRAEYVLGAKRENKRLEHTMNTLLEEKETFNFNLTIADATAQQDHRREECGEGATGFGLRDGEGAGNVEWQEWQEREAVEVEVQVIKATKVLQCEG